MYLKVINKGFNFSQDGPGNRLVYHLQGCNMRCPWCSMPESFPQNGSLIVKGPANEDFCPFGHIKDGKPNFDECALCVCKPCTKILSSPLYLSYKDVSLDDLISEAVRSRPMFFAGGGVTFTGGEATLQFPALKEALKRLKAQGIHTALETNASVSKLPQLFDYVDWLIIDYNHDDAEKLKDVVGLGNERILKNLKGAAKNCKQLLVHIPLFKGINASILDAHEFAKTFRSLNFPQLEIEFLPYHEYGKDKWSQCGLEYKMQDAFVSDQEVKEIIDVFKSYSLNIVNT